MSEYPPRLYDLIHRGNPGDIDFYLAACEGAGGILELGCGSGRISHALAGRGHRVVGIDLNPLMVESAAGSVNSGWTGGGSFEALVADMRSFDLGRRFERIIAPYNALLCLLDRGDLERCMERVAEHLADGGVFVCDFYVASFETRPDDLEMEEHLVSVEMDGELVHVFERDISGGSRDRFDVEYIYRRETAGGVVESRHPILQRSLGLEELRRVAKRVGLAVSSVFPDFEPGEISNETESIACYVSKLIAG